MPDTPRFTPKPARVVDVVVFPAVQLLDATGPLQVFASTNEIVARMGLGDVPPCAPPYAPPCAPPCAPPYAPRVVARQGEAVTASAGLVLGAAPLPPVDAPLDTLLVAGGPGVRAAASDPALLAWLQARSRHARRVVSVCTGAFLLAAAGLLDGRRAVTHWSFCAELARLYPAVRVEADPIFLRDGTVWTSAGVTAGIDLALALVEEDLGRDLALAVARHLVMFLKRPGGQAQFSTALSLQANEDRFDALHAWIVGHLADDLSLPVLAREAGMSDRSFSRHYTRATGVSPGRAVERLRVEAARRMLLDSGTPVKRVAQRCGFGSEETMRRSFLRLLATTPQDYRTRFSA
ncbi:MAG TPA: helix-turn-helix domain-containing protein [Rhodopila sp.]|uniref:GlxA family transcriptional regulator n=1 Tax=Rhodopila sp. TaxID=2480087 RepID=UPI002CC5F63D|nr:helix-turn-helix domain-containing protein [Rhodopila sp.]HVY14959.1 helix-turn-helix domain-containing protein [Rhodopila sp.]